jgi:hypothetical protein
MEINDEKLQELDEILEEVISKSNENEDSICSVFSEEEVKQNFSDDKQDYLNNPIQVKHEKILTGVYSMLAIFCFCFGIYVFLYFLPDELFQKNFFEIYFKTKCCSTIYNETRCKVEYYCKNIFDSWVKKNNLTDKLLNNCCYWLSPYSKNITTLYCNPYCI